MKALQHITKIAAKSRRDLIATLLIALIVSSNSAPTVLGRTGRNMSVSNQTQIFSIGIATFQDERGTNPSPELGLKIAQGLKQRLIADHKDVLPKLIDSQSDNPSSKEMTVEQLVTLGKQYGVKFVVRGGVLGVTADLVGDEIRASVQLYAEIITLESATINIVRADGTAVQNGKSAEPPTSELQNSAQGRALTSAIEQLAAAIHRAILSPAPDEARESKSQEEVSGTEEVVAAEADEELQQFIAQAEALMSDGAGGNDASLKALSRAMEGLRAALNSKATLMEKGEDTSRANEAIAARKVELQSAISTVSEQVASAEGPAVDATPPSVEKKSVLAHIGESLGEALNIMQKIQEMRSALRGADENGVEQSVPAQEVVEEVSGVVTESGEPVEGVTVTEPESGATATTDGKGAYTMRVVAGRMTSLSLTKGGRQLGQGKIEVLRGRPQIADFQLSSTVGKSDAAPALRIIPSTVVVNSKNRRAAGSGVLKGTVTDSKGKPLARALVNLNGLAMARTDSEGRYVFLNVPPGDHQVSVQKSGLKLKSTQVPVSAKRTSEPRIKFSSDDRIAKEPTRQPLILTGMGTVLRGMVRDEDKRALAAAKITAIQSAAAVSVMTSRQGNYEFRDLKPGPYRLLIAKAGYEAVTETVALRAGKTEERDFKVKKSESAYIGRVLDAKRTSRVESRNQDRPVDSTRRPIEMKKEQPTGGLKVGRDSGGAAPIRPGQLRGLVIDARSGRPIGGASISISGRGSITTGSDGSYGVSNLSPGPYQLIVRKTGFSGSGGTVTVRAGETATASFRLTPALSPPIRMRVPGRS